MSTSEPELRRIEDLALNLEFLHHHEIVPLQGPRGTIVAAANPPTDDTMTAIRFAFGDIELRIMPAGKVKRYLTDYYGNEPPPILPKNQNNPTSPDELEELAQTAPIVRELSRLLAEATHLRASDIHVEPTVTDYVIRFRIDGRLLTEHALSENEGLALVSRVKILAGLDIAERRRPQDGRMSHELTDRAIDIRVATTPTTRGEGVVLRLLDRHSMSLDFEELGYGPQQISVLKSLLRKPHGLVLLTGPTGSGKTTTLYAFLSEIADGSLKIMTIEDPVEFQLDHVSQSQVNSKAGLTFSSALRTFVRHDPDVLMVGEIRDLETAEIAIQAALTGHLVFSTLHTNSAASAVTRLRDLGVKDYLIASTLEAVISQRLIPKRCPACKGVGCEQCSQIGRIGRTVVAEILTVTGRVETAIRDRRDETEIEAGDDDFESIQAHADCKISKGLITQADADRVLGR